MKPPERIEVEMDDLEEILERARSTLGEDDYEKLKAAVETLGYLTHELEAKRVAVGRLKKLLFGAGSEKTAEVFSDSAEETPQDSEGGAPTGDASAEEKEKRQGHGHNGAKEYEGAERIEVPHPSLKSGDACPESKCKGKVYRLKEPRHVLRITGQAPVKAKLYELEKLRCNLCGTVFTAEPPPEMGEEKYDATSASMIALLKYGSGLPFNRLERLEGSLGIPLPAATQWDIVHQASKLLQPACEELIGQAAQGEVVHNDDTGMKILELMGKRWKRKHSKSKAKKKGAERSGVFTSGIVSVGDGRKIALFFTGRKHAGENIAAVLAKRAAELEVPIQMCDALSRNMPAELKAVVANCLAHGRRQFVDVAANFPAECRRVLETLGDVYRNDAKAREDGLSAEERLRFHRERSRPLMIELRRWFRTEINEKRIEPNSSLGTAISYMKKHWLKLTQFYRRAGAPLDNNVCERALKKAILHRKNAYFYKTENGARVGDLYMSLIYTAELSGVSPFDYLTELQKNASLVAVQPSRWMPWNYRAALEPTTDSAPA